MGKLYKLCAIKRYIISDYVSTEQTISRTRLIFIKLKFYEYLYKCTVRIINLRLAIYGDTNQQDIADCIPIYLLPMDMVYRNLLCFPPLCPQSMLGAVLRRQSLIIPLKIISIILKKIFGIKQIFTDFFLCTLNSKSACT